MFTDGSPDVRPMEPVECVMGKCRNNIVDRPQPDNGGLPAGRYRLSGDLDMTADKLSLVLTGKEPRGYSSGELQEVFSCRREK